MADAIDDVASVLVGWLLVGDGSEAGSLTAVADVTDSRLDVDREPATGISRAVVDSFGVDVEGVSVSVLEAVGVVVASFPCRRAMAAGPTFA